MFEEVERSFGVTQFTNYRRRRELMVEAGVPISKVAQFLGHTNESIT